MKWLREHALGLTMFGFFAVFLVGQSVTGQRNFNQEQAEHKQPQVGYVAYLSSGDFVESVFENWESEFLQMAAYVVLTVFLRHKGSAESKKLEGEEAVDKKPQRTTNPNASWPIRRGGVWLKLYEHSFSLALLLLFLISFGLHAYGGARATTEENLTHGDQPVSTVQYLTTSKFWFESLQNWQSEFLAVGTIVVLSVYLREKGSPESKPVSAPHAQTGSQ